MCLIEIKHSFPVYTHLAGVKGTLGRIAWPKHTEDEQSPFSVGQRYMFGEYVYEVVDVGEEKWADLSVSDMSAEVGQRVTKVTSLAMMLAWDQHFIDDTINAQKLRWYADVVRIVKDTYGDNIKEKRNGR